MAVLLLLGVALPAWSASVVDVRVGKHPTFTRVVFELDSPTGYKLERNEPAPGIAELVVSLRARAEVARVATPKASLIESLVMEAQGGNAVARIRLAQEGLRLKEMILTQPPRIVLDVLAEEAPAVARATAAPSKPKAASKPAPAPKLAKAKPEPKPVIAPKPEPAPVARVVPSAEAVIENVPASPSSSIGEPGEPPIADPIEFEADAPSDPTASAADDEAEQVEPVAFDGAADQAATEPIEIARATPPASAARPRTELPSATSTAGSARAKSDQSLFTLRNSAIGLAGFVLLVAGGYVVARRRSDVGEVEDDFDSDGFGGDNPFAELEQETSGEAGSPGTPPAFGTGFDSAGPETEGPQSDLFGSASRTASAASRDSNPNPDQDGSPSEPGQEGSAMSMDPTTDFSADPNAMTTMPGGMAGPDGAAVMRLVRELESRVVNLESRLEEAVDARERLERQVAAQTEELRVQRAAIARTQRAVRNLSQPIEDTPTEPALREPQQ